MKELGGCLLTSAEELADGTIRRDRDQERHSFEPYARMKKFLTETVTIGSATPVFCFTPTDPSVYYYLDWKRHGSFAGCHDVMDNEAMGLLNRFRSRCIASDLTLATQSTYLSP